MVCQKPVVVEAAGKVKGDPLFHHLRLRQLADGGSSPAYRTGRLDKIKYPE